MLSRQGSRTNFWNNLQFKNKFPAWLVVQAQDLEAKKVGNITAVGLSIQECEIPEPQNNRPSLRGTPTVPEKKVRVAAGSMQPDSHNQTHTTRPTQPDSHNQTHTTRLTQPDPHNLTSRTGCDVPIRPVPMDLDRKNPTSKAGETVRLAQRDKYNETGITRSVSSFLDALVWWLYDSGCAGLYALVRFAGPVLLVCFWLGLRVSSCTGLVAPVRRPQTNISTAEPRQNSEKLERTLEKH